VDEEASQDSKRRYFFKWLGVKQYAPLQVCDLILELHSKPLDSQSERDDDDLIDDLEYLFRHRSLLRYDEVPDIFFVTRKNGVVARQKNQIYIVNKDRGAKLIEKYRNKTGNPFAVLDDRYEARICFGNDRTTRTFHTWLLASASNFSAAPILVRGPKLTLEWEFLLKSSVTDLLFAVQLSQQSSSQAHILSSAVSNLSVKCRDGKHRRLCGLALPTTTLLRECPHLDFADFKDPTTQNWGFLSSFGVITTCNTIARLRELEALSRQPLDEINVDAVHDIYRALSSWRRLDEDDIK